METLYCLHIANMHGKQNIKNSICVFVRSHKLSKGKWYIFNI
jgi:hypothetical protein